MLSRDIDVEFAIARTHKIAFEARNASAAAEHRRQDEVGCWSSRNNSKSKVVELRFCIVMTKWRNTISGKDRKKQWGRDRH